MTGGISLCSEYEVREDLRDRCRRLTQTAVAKQLGFSVAFINDVLHERRKITTDLLHKMGYIRIVQYQKLWTDDTDRRAGEHS